MTLAVALLLGLLIGGVLGALGGGGAILTVPALVYLVGMSPQDATTASLVIVGLTAVVGALSHTRHGQVRWPTGIAFGSVGVAAAFAGTVVNRLVDPRLLLLGFAALMSVAATGMLLRSRTGPAAGRPEPPGGQALQGADAAGGAPRGGVRTARAVASPRGARHRAVATGLKVVLAGTVVGFLTGLFGVGGGFVIVPALVLALGLPMPAAVGTSLVVIAINSASSLAARAGQAYFEWSVIIPFTLTAMAGSVAGKRIAARLSGALLTRSFAVLLLVVAAYVAAGSLLALT